MAKWIGAWGWRKQEGRKAEDDLTGISSLIKSLRREEADPSSCQVATGDSWVFCKPGTQALGANLLLYFPDLRCEPWRPGFLSSLPLGHRGPLGWPESSQATGLSARTFGAEGEQLSLLLEDHSLAFQWLQDSHAS